MTLHKVSTFDLTPEATQRPSHITLIASNKSKDVIRSWCHFPFNVRVFSGTPKDMLCKEREDDCGERGGHSWAEGS